MAGIGVEPVPSLDSKRPFDRWNTDLNVFAIGGAADGDGSRQADFERVCKHRNACFLIVREKKIWDPWTGEPSPSRMRRQCM